MKVLFQNRPKRAWIGGDMIQLEKIMEAVSKQGVEVEFNDQPVYSPALYYRHFDVIHVFNFSMFWTKYQIATAQIQKKPVVASMIYHESEEYLPYKEQQQMLDYTKAAVFLAEPEIERVKRHLTIDEDKIHIIGNGIDEFWFKPVYKSPDIPPFVLTVGRIEPSKGQWGAAVACAKLGIRYLMVGERKDEEYTKECEKVGAIWQAPMEPKDLIRLYASCAVFCLPSKAELYPLTVMEAGAQGRPIVLTENCAWNAGVITCKWHDPLSIEKAISEALKLKENTQLKDKLKQMTWDNVAKEYIKIYQNVCNT